MAKTRQVPTFVRLANMMTRTMLRAGFKIAASGGAYPMYLLTVRGRKSGQPRTVPIVTVEQDGERYLVTPFGVVDWVRNLRAAGEATLTRGRRMESVRARELPKEEAALVLQRSIVAGVPTFLEKYFGVTATSSPEDFAHIANTHPVFLLQMIRN